MMRRCTLEPKWRGFQWRRGCVKGDPALAIDAPAHRHAHARPRATASSRCGVTASTGTRLSAMAQKSRRGGRAIDLESDWLHPAGRSRFGGGRRTRSQATAAICRRLTAACFPVRTVGVTGSSGKTSTKELIAVGACVRAIKTKATQGNLNNHIGVPLTLLIRLDEDDEFGSDRDGDESSRRNCAGLAQMAAPEIGVISSIGPAHIEYFSRTRRRIAEEKAELIAALPAHGVAILNSDDANGVRQGLPHEPTRARVVWVGSGAEVHLARGADQHP